MITYKLLKSGGVQRLPDGAFIPPTPDNMDWQRYQEWLVLGNIPQTEPIEELQAAAWMRIKAERDRRTVTGGYRAAGKWFHSDKLSRTQQLGLVLLGANIPPQTQWKTMDGSFILMTQQLAQQIFAAAVASDIAVFAAAEQHKTAMLQAPDPTAYDFSGGWPPMFAG